MARKLGRSRPSKSRKLAEEFLGRFLEERQRHIESTREAIDSWRIPETDGKNQQGEFQVKIDKMAKLLRQWTPSDTDPSREEIQQALEKKRIDLVRVVKNTATAAAEMRTLAMLLQKLTSLKALQWGQGVPARCEECSQDIPDAANSVRTCRNGFVVTCSSASFQ